MFGLRAATRAFKGRVRSLERLSTGMRLNRASDGPAELVLSKQLDAQIAGIRQGIDNLQTGNNVISIADAALGEITSLILRLQAIIVGASNGTMMTNDQLDALQQEVAGIISAVDRMSQTTRYAGDPLTNGRLRKTSEFVKIPPRSASLDVYVPPFSEIAPGLHRLVVEKGATVVTLDFSGVVGEGGLITDEAGADVRPEFSADGSRLVYLNALGDIINRNTRDTHLPPGAPAAYQVTAGEAGVDEFHFAPNGTQIVYEALNGGQSGVFVRNADGSGGRTQLGAGLGAPNTDPSVPVTGANRVVYDAPYPNGQVVGQYAAPGGGNITGLARGPGNTMYALSDVDNAVYLIDAFTGAPVGPQPFIALGAGNYDGIAYDPGGNRLFILDQSANPALDQIHVYDSIGGGFINTFSIGAQVFTPVAGNPNTGDPGALTITSAPVVVDASQAPTAENFTLEFTSTPTPSSNGTYQVTGSVSGVVANGTFTSGIPITVRGVQFTLSENTTTGSSVSAVGATSVNRSRMLVSLDGDAPIAVTFPAGEATANDIVNAIQAQLGGRAVVGWDGTNYTIDSTFGGHSSSVVVTAGAAGGTLRSAAGGATFLPQTPPTAGFATSNGGTTTIQDDGIEDQLTITVDGVGPVTMDINNTGADLTGGAAIANAIQTTFGGVFAGLTCTWDGANYTVTSGTTGASSSVSVGGGPGSAGDLLNLRAGDGATVRGGFDALRRSRPRSRPRSRATSRG
jgi:flagellin-like hook-associated protein FlgL